MGPKSKLLVIYNALVRGYYDYRLVAYGSSCKTNISLIETARRSILRLILGSLKPTPVNILYNELGIERIVMHKEWLAINYVCKVCLTPRHSNYALIVSLAQSTFLDFFQKSGLIIVVNKNIGQLDMLT